ncbi:MAG: hypothetical protein WKF91_20655 [Segetibacter sp.]
MHTLFDPAVNQEIVNRIGKLSPASKPGWGKMTVVQMLAHLNLSLQVNFGKIELKRSLLGIFFRGISRRILLGEKPFPKNLPTDKKLLSKHPADFITEKKTVETMVRMYVDKGPKVLSKNPHNILGKITPQESAFISYKHLDHHLRQFGV